MSDDNSKRSLRSSSSQPNPSPKLSLADLAAENAAIRAKYASIEDKLDKLIQVNAALFSEVKVLREENKQLKAQNDPPPTPQAATVSSRNKKKYDLLILSDSIFRHIGCDGPKVPRGGPNLSIEDDIAARVAREVGLEQDLSIPLQADPPISILIKKRVIPGATVHNLFYAAKQLAEQCSFEHILLHVGTNYLGWSDWDSKAISDDITSFLTFLKDTFACSISFSSILPRTDNQLLNRIADEVNNLVTRFCHSNYMQGFMVIAFCWEPSRFLARDGVHLNRRGILAMEYALLDFLADRFWCCSISGKFIKVTNS